MADKFKDPLNSDIPFIIPQKFWQQLESFTRGGFICFYIDSFGEIQVECRVDDQVHEEGLRAWSSRFLNSMNSAQEIGETQEFLGMDPGGRNDCERFDEEDEE